MNRIFTIICLLCLLVSTTVDAQTTSESITFGGLTRTYQQHLPPGYVPGTDVPLVLMLHGLGDTGPAFMTGTGFNSVADAETFITISPDAGDIFGFGQGWNAGASPFITTDDVGFLDALIDHLKTTLSIDEARVYATGFSLGSMMCHRIACELSDKVTAVAGVGGPLAPTVAAACSPCREVPVMHIHGDADSVLFWGGTSSFVYEANSVPATMEHWATINGCDMVPDTTAIPDAFAEGLTFDQIVYSSCNAGSEVILYRVNGGEHAWYLGSVDIDYNQTIWSFLNGHTMTSCETAIEDELTAGVDLHFGPNPVNETLKFWSEELPFERIEVLDVTGRKIMDQSINNAYSVEVSTDKWVKGIYLVKVEAQGKKGSFRIIKE